MQTEQTGDTHVMIRNESAVDKQPYANPKVDLSDAQSRDGKFAPPTTGTSIFDPPDNDNSPPPANSTQQSRCGTFTPRNGCPFRTMVSMRLSFCFIRFCEDVWEMGKTGWEAHFAQPRKESLDAVILNLLYGKCRGISDYLERTALDVSVCVWQLKT